MKVSISLLIIFWLNFLTPIAAQRQSIYNPATNHSSQSKFSNRFPSIKTRSRYDKIEFLLREEQQQRSYKNGGQIDRTFGYVPAQFQVQPNLNRLKAATSNVRITWLGHASFLLQFGNGATILTDPVFYEMPFASMKDYWQRVSPAIVIPADLPPIDRIVISHNHFDHLNFQTLNKFPLNTHYLLPLKTETLFPSKFSTITSMDWYTSVFHNGVTVSFLPSTHWSKRTPWDSNKMLWGGWLFRYKGISVYFAGDTAFSKLFQSLAETDGPFDYCLLPIMAYKPYAYRNNHNTPEDAIRIATILGCKTVIPWGYGTFILGHEHVLEPLRRLKMAFDDTHPRFKLNPLKMGETLEIALDQ